MDKQTKIYIAGHNGMVGSALVRCLTAQGYTNLVTRTHCELDLTNQKEVNAFFDSEQIGYVVLAAAKVGGIHANNIYPGDFIYQNLLIQANVIHAAHRAGVQEFLFLGSSCIYPRLCPQPMAEEHLLSGYLERTNEPYAIAKIAGISMCESYNRQYGTRYRAVMPANLYGPNDNFDLQNSHVLPAMIRKFHLAKLAADNNFGAMHKDEARFGPIPEDIWQALKGSPPAVKLWGTGAALREFLHVDDMAAACLHVMAMPDRTYQQICRVSPPFQDLEVDSVSHLNIGCGKEITIRRLSEIIGDALQYPGEVVWHTAMPDGTPRKLLDSSRLSQSGWRPRIALEQGVRETYQWYLEQAR
jgi:GDP-L-fucose synthase